VLGEPIRRTDDTGVAVPVPIDRFVGRRAAALGVTELVRTGTAGVIWLLAPAAGADRRRTRRWAWVRTGALTLGVAAALVTGSQALVVAANAGGDAVLPAENPIGSTAESIAAGALAYEATCSGCHGVTGAGDGPIAAGLAVRSSDLATHVPFHSDAELYAFITRGISGTPMPGFATELSPEDRWNLVNYLRDRWPAP